MTFGLEEKPDLEDKKVLTIFSAKPSFAYTEFNISTTLSALSGKAKLSMASCQHIIPIIQDDTLSQSDESEGLGRTLRDVLNAKCQVWPPTQFFSVSFL